MQSKNWVSGKPDGSDHYLQSKLTKKTQDLPTLTIAFPSRLETLRVSYFLSAEGVNIKRIIFKNVSNLRYLDFSYFQMDFLKGISLDGQVNLEHLDVSGIDSNLLLGNSFFHSFTNVSTLIMKDTNLGKTFRDSNIVSDLVSTVKTFDISGNNIWYMNEFTFNMSKNLINLILTNNILLEIPIAVTYIDTLETLDMRFNQLQSINETMR